MKPTKKIVEEEIEKTNQRIAEQERAYATTILMERFGQRMVLLKDSGKDSRQNFLSGVQLKMNQLKNQIDWDKQYVKMLEEIKNDY